MPGPPPKRIEERRRRNLVPGESVIAVDGGVLVPELPSRTHPIAAAWYESLRESGQSAFYEPSDWAAAVLATVVMTKMLRAPRLSGPALHVVWTMMESLLTTETSRRRARLHVQRLTEKPQSDGPTALDEYRRALGGGLPNERLELLSAPQLP